MSGDVKGRQCLAGAVNPHFLHGVRMRPTQKYTDPFIITRQTLPTMKCMSASLCLSTQKCQNDEEKGGKVRTQIAEREVNRVALQKSIS